MKAKMRNGKKGSGCPDVILLAVGIVSLIIFVATGWKLLDYYGEYREQKQGYDELAALRDAGIGGLSSKVCKFFFTPLSAA